MPPAVAAATKTASGRCVPIHDSTSPCLRRSSSVRSAVNTSQSSRASRRRRALPTMPRCPATYTRLPASGKTTDGPVLTAPLAVLGRRGATRRVLESGGAQGALLSSEIEIALHHHPHQLLEADARAPAEPLARLGGVALQRVDLGRPQVTGVVLDMAPPVQPDLAEGDIQQLTHAVRLAGGDHVVVRRVLLEHEPHRLDEVSGEAPVA